jgi:hypothetical protein
MENMNPYEYAPSVALSEPDSMIQRHHDTHRKQGEIDPRRGVRALVSDEQKQGDDEPQMKQGEDQMNV